ARRIACLDRAVQERVRLALVQTPPVLGIDAAHERVGVEGGRAVQRQHLPRIGVQREQGAALPRRKDLADVALQVEIERGVQRRAGDRLEGRCRTCFAHYVAQGAHLDEAYAGAATQRGVG